MTWQTETTLYFLAPFALLWLAFFAAEATKAIALIRKGGRHGR